MMSPRPPPPPSARPSPPSKIKPPDADYDDVVVLNVVTFGTCPDGPRVAPHCEERFQRVNSDFIAEAVTANKTKLIIDLSRNGGGNEFQPYDTFKQLFPFVNLIAGFRCRSHYALSYIAQKFGYVADILAKDMYELGSVLEVMEAFDSVPSELLELDHLLAIVSTSNYQLDLDSNDRRFTSWAQKYGRHADVSRVDNTTAIHRLALDDPRAMFSITGTLGNLPGTEQPFKPENIVIVTDGICASACSLFVQLMIRRGGVRTVALGGRPNKSVMQAVGGVQGGQIVTLKVIHKLAAFPFQHQNFYSGKFCNRSVLGSYNDLATQRSPIAGVNIENEIHDGRPNGPPMQFVYQPVDCKMFYTQAMTLNQFAVWKTVADTELRGISHCVAGGFPHPPDLLPKPGKDLIRKQHGVSEGFNISQRLEDLDKTWSKKKDSPPRNIALW